MLYQVFDIYILCIWRISLNVATSVADYPDVPVVSMGPDSVTVHVK